jgi:hypothetical protein
LLDSAKIEYLIVGGYAVAYHGYPRPISGVSFNDCFARRINAEIDGLRVPIISLEDLKRNKQAAARPKDLNDLKHLDS